MRAGIRSAVVPGWGQLATRHRRLGRILVAASGLTTTAAVAALVVVGPAEVAAWLSHPTSLVALLVVNAFVAAGRLWSTGHAWWATGGRNAAVGVMLAVGVLAPHAAVGWVGGEARQTLLRVFPGSGSSDPEATASITTTTTTLPTTTTTLPTTTTTTPLPTATTLPTTTTTTLPTTTTSAPAASPLGTDRLNVLLLGGDAGPGRSGLRTDTIMVASIDPTTGDAALVGLPRNYGSVRFSDGTAFEGRILNEVYDWGRDHPDVFGGVDPGASAVRDVAEHLTGLEIDHFMLVDLTGFAEVVDVFGGVTIDVPRRLDGPLYDPETGGYTMIEIPAGRQTLDGDRALAYARVRHDSTDYVRMGRQRCLLTALVDTIDPLEVLTGLPTLLDTVERHLLTDVPLDLVPHLIRLADEVDPTAVRVVGFGPESSLGRNDAGYLIPDVDAIRRTVAATVSDPSAAAELGVGASGDVCS